MNDRASTKPLLEIVERDRPWVRIFGQAYEIKTQDELGIADVAHLQALLREYSGLLEKAQHGGEITPEEGARLDPALDRVCRIFLDAPEAIHDRLKPGNRLALVMAFNEVLPPAPETAPAMNRAARRGSSSTQASSRRPSSASTAATPSAG